MTLYLKYRPQTLAELDLDGVRETLEKIILSNRIPHAFLFAGPRGAGKTSAARILAKVINCEQRNQPTKELKNKNTEPCNKCSVCKSITNGSNLDVLEIDAASNRGVDDIRVLRETVKLAPAGSRAKVYIIDEAHMLTTEAANALLKTLEEPPAHVVFILATTAPEKLPETIRSRATFVNFYKGRKPEVVRALRRAVDGEKFEVEPGVLEDLADIVDGSFREAHKLLEQLSFEKKITLEGVKGLITNSQISPETLFKLLIDKNTKEALREINEAGKKGTNLKLYSIEVLKNIREEIIAKVEDSGKTDVGLADLQKLAQIWSNAIKELSTAVIPELELELATVEWCQTQSQFSHSSHNSPSSEETGLARSHSRQEVEVIRTLDSTSQALAQTNENVVPKQAPTFAGGRKEKKDVKDKEKIVVQTIEVEDLVKKWDEILRNTRSKNTSLAALLAATRPLEFDGKVLKVEVFYKFHKEKLESPTYRNVVEEVAAQILSAPNLQMVCSLSESRKKAADVANIAPIKDEDIVKIAEEVFGVTGDGKVH